MTRLISGSVVTYDNKFRPVCYLLDDTGLPIAGKVVKYTLYNVATNQWWNGAAWGAYAEVTMSDRGYGIYVTATAIDTSIANGHDLILIYKESTIPAYGMENIRTSNLWNILDDIKAKTDLIVSGGASQTTMLLVKAKTDLIPASPATEGTSLSIKAKTDLLPATPANEATSILIKAKTDLIPAQPALEPTSLLIKAKTDNLPALPGNETTILAIKAKTDLLPLDPTSEALATSNKDDIKAITSILEGTVMNDGLNTRTTFKTDFSIAINDFFVDQVIVFRTGSFAGLSRRISGYDGATKFITVSPALPTVGGLDSPPIDGAVFSIVARPAPAGSTLTETVIAQKVWDEPLAGHVTGGTSGASQNRILPTEAKVDIVDTVADAIKVQTDKLQFNGSSEVLSEAMRLGANAETEVQQKATDALNAYDPPTRTEATSDKVEIISEVNANEVKVDAVKTVVDGIAVQTTAIDGRLPTDPADQSQVESAILAAQGVLQGEHVTIIAKEDALLAAVLSIQNNTTTVIVVPPIMEKPETPGTKTYRLVLMNYDGVGGMEDFIQNTPGIYECQVKVDEIDGTPIIPYAYLVRDGVGVYHIDFVVNYTDANRPILFTFMLESLLSVIRYATRTSEITDEGTIIEQIKADTTDILIDTGTTLPAQIEAVRVDLNNEIDITEASINSNVDNTRTSILNEITIVENMINDIGNSIITKTSIPNNFAIPVGVSKISEDIGMYEHDIPVYNIDVFQDAGVVKIDGELIVYTGRDTVESKLTGCSRAFEINDNPALPANHDKDVKISQVVISRFMVEYFDGYNNVIDPDDSPIIVFFSDLNQEIINVEMIKDPIRYCWRRDFAFTYEDTFENITYTIKASLVGKNVQESGSLKSEFVYGTQSVIPGASTSGLINGEFLFDQEGWIGTDGVFHDWTDEYKGYVRDENTGDRLQDVVVRAFRVLKDGTVARDYHPPYQSITDILGDFKGALDEGEYEFEFTLSGTVYFRVRRSIG
jgi:hypothetical protein